jgi:hypothetical protein
MGWKLKLIVFLLYVGVYVGSLLIAEGLHL